MFKWESDDDFVDQVESNGAKIRSAHTAYLNDNSSFLHRSQIGRFFEEQGVLSIDIIKLLRNHAQQIARLILEDPYSGINLSRDINVVINFFLSKNLKIFLFLKWNKHNEIYYKGSFWDLAKSDWEKASNIHKLSAENDLFDTFQIGRSQQSNRTIFVDLFYFLIYMTIFESHSIIKEFGVEQFWRWRKKVSAQIS